MKIFFYLIIPKVFAALPGLPGKKPEEYDIKDIGQLVLYFTNVFFTTLIPVAMIMIIWGSYQYLTAYGNEEKAQKGKTIIFWAIVGLVVAILAKVIVGELWKLLTGGIPPYIF